MRNEGDSYKDDCQTTVHKQEYGRKVNQLVRLLPSCGLTNMQTHAKYIMWCVNAKSSEELKDHECPVSPYKEHCFNDGEMSYLTAMYKLLYPNLEPRFYWEFKKCEINGEEFTSLKSRSQQSCVIAAKWRGVRGIDPRGEAPVRVGQVMLFREHGELWSVVQESMYGKKIFIWCLWWACLC